MSCTPYISNRWPPICGPRCHPPNAIWLAALLCLGCQRSPQPGHDARDAPGTPELVARKTRERMTPLPAESSATALKVAKPVEPAFETPAPADDGPGIGVVIATRLNVRKQGGPAQPIAGTLRCGDVVDIEGREGAWYAVKLAELSGFSHSAYIFRIGVGGMRPHCSRGVTARHEPDEPLRSRAERRAIEPQQKSPQEDLPAALDGDSPVAKVKPATPSPAPQEIVKAPDAPTPPIDPAPTPSPVGKPAERGVGPAQILFAEHSSQVAMSHFPHALHQSKLACSKCHHPVSSEGTHMTRGGGTDANQNKRCRSCHIDGRGDVKVAVEDAMHRTCRDCHTAMGPTLAPHAPRRCAECHKP